jgi:hypothetical protein
MEKKYLRKLHPARYLSVGELKYQHSLIKGYIGQVVSDVEDHIKNLID